MTTITRSALVEMLLKEANGTKFINVTYRTEPKVNKSCPFSNVTKTTNNTCMFGVDYEKRMEKKDKEVAGAKPWFDPIDGQVWIVQHITKDKRYLRLSPTGNNKPVSTYDSAQGPLTKEELKPYFYKSSGDPPEVITVDLDNLLSIKYAGVEYRVIDDNRLSTTATTSEKQSATQ